MREIKFRAWVNIKLDPWLAKPDIIDSIDLNDKTIYGNGCWCFNLTDEAVIMQYTGLEDKNGKEIYEGDIVTCYPGERLAYQKTVEWADDRPELGITNHTGGLILCKSSSNKYIEVIGNIYENPELLENTK